VAAVNDRRKSRETKKNRIVLFQVSLFAMIKCVSVTATPEGRASGNTQEEVIKAGNALGWAMADLLPHER